MEDTLAHTSVSGLLRGRPAEPAQPHSPASQPSLPLSKVPEVTLYFWVIKVLCTTVGETGADFLNADLGFGLSGTSVVMAGLLALVLVLQFRERTYVPWTYWLAVVLVSIVGTLVTDNLVDNAGVSLEVATIGFGLALAAAFVAWYQVEGTLSIHSIRTTRREAFYWVAILLTFALGTAAGDLVAEQLNVGYFNSVLLFGGLIAVVTIAHVRLGLNAVLAFWLAYVLTRPLGASLGDLLSQDTDVGGLGLGTIATSALFLAAILALVAYLARSRIDAPVDAPA